MLQSILESLVLPVACGSALLLAPRLPWCTDRGSRTDAWTGSLAIALVALLSLVMVDGADSLLLKEKWHSIALSAAIVGVGGLLASRDSSKLSTCAFVALTIFVLRLPGYESLTTRVILSSVAVVASLAFTSVAQRDSVRAPLSLAISLASLAALLLHAGSLKAACIAASLASLCTAAATFSLLNRSFSPGATLSIAAVTLSFALAIYGCAYHAPSDAEPWTFFVVWASPLTIALPAAQRSARHANAAIALVAIICAVTVVCALRSSDAAGGLEQENEGASSYTLMNEKGTCDNRAFSWHCTVTV